MKNIATFQKFGFMGELGNQMFQVAAVSAYAKRFEKNVIFPEWICKKTGRDYTKIFKNPVTQGHVNLDPTTFTTVLYNDLKFIELPNIENNVNFEGYFQSEKYFNDFRDEVKEMFTPTDEITEYLTTKYADLIREPNKVAMHVRTGRRSQYDYHDIHVYASRNFIEKSQENFSHDTYAVFTDHLEAAKEMLPSGKKYIFIENEENYIDMFLMNYFDSYIVSPSTFGWWGAWLSHSTNPKVVTVKDWFVKGGALEHLNDNDQIPDNWKKI